VAPAVPTISESGYPGFDAIAWHGIAIWKQVAERAKVELQ
jgi:tripartite-type tricarboxylate transporter receptor subunit TctC